MLDIREELKFCCNAFLKDRQETDAVNYVSIVVNFLIRNHHLIECCKLWNRYLLF